jgi:hypothetical protein
VGGGIRRVEGVRVGGGGAWPSCGPRALTAAKTTPSSLRGKGEGRAGTESGGGGDREERGERERVVGVSGLTKGKRASMGCKRTVRRESGGPWRRGPGCVRHENGGGWGVRWGPPDCARSFHQRWPRAFTHFASASSANSTKANPRGLPVPWVMGMYCAGKERGDGVRERCAGEKTDNIVPEQTKTRRRHHHRAQVDAPRRGRCRSARRASGGRQCCAREEESRRSGDMRSARDISWGTRALSFPFARARRLRLTWWSSRCSGRARRCPYRRGGAPRGAAAVLRPFGVF